jgi:gas vesicle structural protein
MNSSSELEPETPVEPLPEVNSHERVSLCDALDRMLNKGVVVAGEIVISVADVDLIYLNLQLLLTSIETARQQWRQSRRFHAMSLTKVTLHRIAASEQIPCSFCHGEGTDPFGVILTRRGRGVIPV